MDKPRLFPVFRAVTELTNDELLDRYPADSEDKPEIRAEILRRMGPCTRSHGDYLHQQQGLGGFGIGLGQR